MKIQGSTVNLSSENKKISFDYEHFQLKVITSAQNKENISKNLSINILKLNIENVDLNSDSISEKDLKTFIIKFLIQKLTGKEFKSLSLKDLNKLSSSQQNIEIPQYAAEIEYEKLRYEKESVSFKAEGKIITKNGKEIKFDISFSLNREMIDYTKLNIKFGSAALIDPLIINFDGDLNYPLSDTKFEFDLDNDGKSEKISNLTSGNGFLVFDKNENKKIDNGSELFGTKTGNGFKELSEYDTDKNGWIDEQDEIFKKLNVWLKTDSINQLKTLEDLNIGAIYLGNTSTHFNYEGNGKLQNSSVYLKENGNVGIISKIDFVV